MTRIEYHRQYRWEHRETLAASKWASHLMRKYNLSVEDWARLYEAQKGHCALCDENDPNKLEVDHDHTTGTVRGLLCGRDNVGIGLLGDTEEGLERALDYIRKANSRGSLGFGDSETSKGFAGGMERPESGEGRDQCSRYLRQYLWAVPSL